MRELLSLSLPPLFVFHLLGFNTISSFSRFSPLLNFRGNEKASQVGEGREFDDSTAQLKFNAR